MISSGDTVLAVAFRAIAAVTAEIDFQAGTSVRMSRSHAAYPGFGGAAQEAGR
jgi:hypothetical protein